MSNYNSNFTVPTLSLSTSRAKKTHNAVVPTRDYAYQFSSVLSNGQNDPVSENRSQQNITNNVYTQPEKYRRPHIFPPKPPAPPQHQHLVTNAPEYSMRDLNKNVYLESADEYVEGGREGNPQARLQDNYRGELRQSGSRRGLLGNPLSSRQVQQQLNQRGLSRKAEISKVLFDRRLSKLMEEANFYDGEMMALCRDELAPHLSELQRIREENVSSHREILSGLGALIK